MYPINLPIIDRFNPKVTAVISSSNENNFTIIDCNGMTDSFDNEEFNECFTPRYTTTQEYFNEVMKPQEWYKDSLVGDFEIEGDNYSIAIEMPACTPELAVAEWLKITPELIEAQRQALDHSLTLRAISELQKQ